MLPVDQAILRTVLYADIFQFALTLEELHTYLIHDQAIEPEIIRAALDSAPLRSVLCLHQGYVVLHQHRDYSVRRQQQEQITRRLWARAERYGHWLSYLPFVRMVALTGALAARNPVDDRDDFDYMLVTQPGRVWLSRAFAIALVRLVRLLGDEICPNYVVSQDHLRQHQDLYVAQEIAHMVPIYGYAVYLRLWQANPWLRDYMPNATPVMREMDSSRWGKGLLEYVLRLRPGDWLEAWEYRRKQHRFATHARQVTSAARISPDEVKGHFDDHGMTIMEQYERRLALYGLALRPA